jgi:hypothetical protein
MAGPEELIQLVVSVRSWTLTIHGDMWGMQEAYTEWIMILLTPESLPGADGGGPFFSRVGWCSWESAIQKIDGPDWDRPRDLSEYTKVEQMTLKLI